MSKFLFLSRNTSIFLVLLSVLNFQATAIITRHDVDDSEYFHFGEKFRSSIANLNINPKVPDCMATFLTDHWLITAAHCAVLIEEKLKKGSGHEVEFRGSLFDVEKVGLHPEYVNTRSVQDIALVKLKRRVPGSRSLSILKDPFKMREMLYVVGYGDKGNGLIGPNGNDKKLRAGTNLLDFVSNEWVRFVFDAPDSQNTTELEAISGPGDSGGPAFVKRGDRYLIAGISSRQSTRATSGREGIYGVTEFYARASTYADWIDATLSKG